MVPKKGISSPCITSIDNRTASFTLLYVVVEELIPEMSAGEHSNIGVVAFAVGFTLMMTLDVALG